MHRLRRPCTRPGNRAGREGHSAIVSETRPAVVLGVGNILLSDEGIGVHAVNALEPRDQIQPEVAKSSMAAHPPWTASTRSPRPISSSSPTASAGGGRVTRPARSDSQLQAFFRTKISPHQVGLSDVLATLNLHRLAPARTVLIGAEPKIPSARPGTNARACRHDTCALVEALAAELNAAGLENRAPQAHSRGRIGRKARCASASPCASSKATASPPSANAAASSGA